MNKKWIGSFGAVLLAALSLHAQSPQSVVAKIPFNFQAGKVMLPAGEYEVDTRLGPGIVRLASHEQKAAAILLTINKYSAVPDTRARLVFNRYDNEYFLAQVWNGAGTGREFPKSKREKEIALTAGLAQRETLLAKAVK